MLAFRKWFLALALVTLTVAVASAQNVPAFQCVANAGVPPIVRAEGIAELVGDLVLNCNNGIPTTQAYAGTGGLATTGVPQVNVQIFLNTNVTSKLISTDINASEALLMIDEPTAAEQNVCLASAAPCTVLANHANPGRVYKTWSYGERNVAAYNVFQGRQQGANSLVWLGVPIDAPGTTFTRIIRITNVRANANQLGVSSTLVPTQIVAFISATGTTSVPINNPQQTVAWIQQGMSFSVRNLADNGGAPGFTQCTNTNKDLFNDSTNSGACAQVRLRFSEGFASAFKTAFSGNGQTSGPDQATPGQIYQASESGFFSSLSSWTGLGTTGKATQGTRLRVVFNNVPAGVRLFVTLGNDPANAADRATLVNVAADGSGGYVPTTRATSTSSGCSKLSSVDIAEVPIFGGTGSAVWEITVANALAIDSKVDFGLVVAYAANTTNNLPGLGTATVNGMFAPVSTVVTASAVAPVPRFADTSSAKTVFSISQCVSNILFPWVSNQAGFDTGLVIVNTSKDIFGTALEAGTCTINYFGDTNGGAAPPAQTSGVVPAGDYVAWSLYSGGKFGVTATPGFQGYIIAQCKFRWAHGYAFISDLGINKWAQGYVALILDSASNTRGTSGESLGN